MFGFGKKKPGTQRVSERPWARIDRGRYVDVRPRTIPELYRDPAYWSLFLEAVSKCGVDGKEMVTRARTTGDLSDEEQNILRYAQYELALYQAGKPSLLSEG